MIPGGAPAPPFFWPFSRPCRRFPDGRRRMLPPSSPGLRAEREGRASLQHHCRKEAESSHVGFLVDRRSLGLGRAGHPDRARGRAGHRQPRFHLHPHLAPAYAGTAPPGLPHRSWSRARHAPGAAFRHRLDRQSDRAPGHDLRQSLLVARFHPHGRRHLFAAQGDHGAARAPGRRHGRILLGAHALGLLAGHHPDPGAGCRVLPGFHHHLGGHGGPYPGDDAGRRRGHAGHGHGRRAADKFCGASPHGHHPVSGLFDDDRPEPAHGRPGLPYPQGLPLRGHLLLGTGGDLQPGGPAQPPQAHQHARHA